MLFIDKTVDREKDIRCCSTHLKLSHHQINLKNQRSIKCKIWYDPRKVDHPIVCTRVSVFLLVYDWFRSLNAESRITRDDRFSNSKEDDVKLRSPPSVGKLNLNEYQATRCSQPCEDAEDIYDILSALQSRDYFSSIFRRITFAANVKPSHQLLIQTPINVCPSRQTSNYPANGVITSANGVVDCREIWFKTDSFIFLLSDCNHDFQSGNWFS